ncbi:GHMP kinase, partial [PVC group bacterium]|nr:GHMP kinase [PVC group bacterium]
RNFTIRYSSNIPHLVGLAGSSAIITACMRALMAFYGVTIPKTQLANLILSVETEELQISAGLQDRVAQTYQGLVYMDFDESLMRKQGYGCYEELDVSLISNIYIAYRTNLAQISGVFHSDMRHRFRKRDRDVLDAIEAWKELTTTARNMITNGEAEKLAPLLDANFDHRAALGGVSDGNMELVRLARSAGVSAKLTGSGGAIVGTYENEQMFQKLKETMTTNEIEVLKPNIASALKES